jgi:hypothetical protein
MKWLRIVSEAFAKTDGSRDAVADWLDARAGGDARVSAFAEGVCELARYAARTWEEDDTAVEAEVEAAAASRRIVRPLLQAKLQARVDLLDAASWGRSACPHCGEAAGSQGQRSREWDSSLGPLELRRRYVHCKPCGAGFAPAQQTLGLTDSDFTPRLEEIDTLMTTTVPFGMAKTLVSKLCGVDISVKASQDMTERRAKKVLALQAEEAAAYAPFDDKGLAVENPQRPPDAVAEGCVPEVAYLEIDGVIPITREELLDDELTDIERQRQKRAKKNKVPGGKGKRYRIVGREVKNAVLYDGKDCADETVGRGCILDKTYVSFLGEWAPFALRLWVAMLRLRFDQAKLVVMLSDGADWIRSLANWLPIPVLLILDLFHVKHRIWEVAHSLYGSHSAKASRWAHRHCQHIENGDARKVIAALRRLDPQRAESQELVRRLVGYLRNNLGRMDYPEYRARGLRVSSGAVESANFHVTGNRLKLQGMRWSADGAAEMAALRADLFNGQHESRTRQLLAA